MFTLYGQDNDLTFFEDREDVQRCESCGLLLSKWDEDLSHVRIPRLRLDVSCSYDGVMVVSSRFKEVFEETGMRGLEFIPLDCGYFTVRAKEVLMFDSEKRKTRFVGRCSSCSQDESIVGATPVFLREGSTLDGLAFARSDLEFGSGDEKTPILFCGDDSAKLLSEGGLKGLDLEKVAG